MPRGTGTNHERIGRPEGGPGGGRSASRSSEWKGTSPDRDTRDTGVDRPVDTRRSNGPNH